MEFGRAAQRSRTAIFILVATIGAVSVSVAYLILVDARPASAPELPFPVACIGLVATAVPFVTVIAAIIVVIANKTQRDTGSGIASELGAAA